MNKSFIKKRQKIKTENNIRKIMNKTYFFIYIFFVKFIYEHLEKNELFTQFLTKL